MIIKSLELKNIRSYKNVKIEFKQGINLLSGDIGSGKSSILQAIEFALLGFKKGDLEGYQILRKGKNEAEIKLILENTSTKKQIEIFRKIKKTNNTDTITQENGYIIEENNLLELSPQELNTKIFQILNFPKEFLTKDKNLIYRFTIYTPQEQLKEILYSESDKRLELIRKLFGIDKYKQLCDAISLYLTKTRENKKILLIKTQPEKETEEEIKKITQEIESLKKDTEQTQIIQKPIKEKIQKCKEAINQRENILQRLKNAITQTEKQITKIEECEKQLKTLQKEKDQKNLLLQNLQKNRTPQKEESLQKELKEKEKEIQTLQKEKQEKQNTLQQFEILKKQKEEINQNLNDIEKLKAYITSAKNSFDYTLTKCKIKDLENKITKTQKELTKSEKTKESLEKIKIEIIKLEFEKNQNEEKLQKNQKALQNLPQIETCPICIQKVPKEHKKQILNQLNTENNQITTKNKEIEKQLKTLQEKKQEFETKTVKLNKTEKELLEEKEKLKILKQTESKEKPLHQLMQDKKKQLENLKEKETKEKLNKIEKDLENEKQTREQIEKSTKKEIETLNQIQKIKIELTQTKNIQEQINRLQKEIEQTETTIKQQTQETKNKTSLIQKLKEIHGKDQKIEHSKQKIQTIIESLHEKDKKISNRLSQITTELKNKEENLKEKTKILANIKNTQNQIQNLIQKENFLTEKVTKITNKTEKILFTKYYIEFNEELEKLFKNLIEDAELDIRLSENFSPIIEQNGYEISTKNLSGGEKSSLAVAYRLGLKKIIENNLKKQQKLSLLILDEPTDGFSSQQIERLGNILKESQTKQIILVSHDRQIETIAQTIFQVEKINHISQIIE